ncbi:MAG TPA: radical SAM protein [Planctomycetota bacterium]|nr:radical SAM protein [Planctomycetota bacterium]
MAAVLLLNTNVTRCGRTGYPVTPAPAGLISLAGVLRRRGHDVRIVQVTSHVVAQDENDVPLVCDELAAALREFEPDVIGISTRNVSAGRVPANPFRLVQYHSAFYDGRVVRACRRVSGAPVVMGGTGFSIEPGLCWAVAQPDFGLIGEAEETLPALIEAAAAGRPTDGIQGLVTSRETIGAACRAPGRVADLATAGPGACDAVQGLHEHYYTAGGLLPIQTKRGCAMECIYCPAPFLEGHRYRFRPLEHVMEEVRAYRQVWGVRHFFFADPTFNHPVDHAMALCEAILSAGLGIEWYGEVTPACLPDHLAALMARAGCIGVTLGLDSCSEATLASYRKPFGMAEVREAIAVLRRHGIPFDTSLIVGGPGETLETFAETMAFCDEHLRDVVVRFFDGMILSPNTPAYQIAAAEGVINPATPYEDLVLANDFRRVKRYSYFFPHAAQPQRALRERLANACRGERWLLSGKDYVPDPNTGELGFGSDIVVEPGARPWWRGLHRWKGGAAAPAGRTHELRAL